jgi:ABC-2 type transport system ATP-binding protein
MNDVALEAILLNKRYKGKTIALNDFSIKLRTGSILGLSGPNGAGKSTFINISANILKRDSGVVLIFNERIHEDSFSYKYKCGFLFEKPVYIDKFTIKEYLSFAGILFGLRKRDIFKRIDELSSFFDFKDKQNEWILKGSKGIKKKVSIAAALIHNPSLLILDEPFADLDMITIEKVKDLIIKMKGKGVAVLMASNNIRELERICDTIAIIDKGTIIFEDDVRNINGVRYRTWRDKKDSNLEKLYFRLLRYNEKNINLSWFD